MNNILSAPLEVTLSLTPKCNLSCRHCFATAKKSDSVHLMDLQEWMLVIDQLGEAKVFNVLFSGGEPLLFENFEYLCEYTISKHINCSLNTNGTLVTKPLAQWMKNLPFRGRISVSLDGAKKETHEYMRGNDTFESTVRGIKYLVDCGLNVQIFFVVTNHNWREIKDIVYLAKQLGCFQVYFNEVYPVGNGNINGKDLQLTKENYIDALMLCSQLIDEGYNDFISGTFISQMNLYSELMYRQRIGEVCCDSRLNGCGNGSRSVVINYDGTVAPCEMLLGVSCGNILKSSLTEIWHNSDILNKFRNLTSVKVSQLTGCSECRIQDVCDGGCRALPYLEGDFCGMSRCMLRDIIGG